MLVCPICKNEYKSLVQHLVMKHNLTKDEIKNKFPGIQLHEDSREKDLNLICEHCGKICKTKNALMSHVKYKHPEKYTKNIIERKSGIQCLICNKICPTNITQHLMFKHKLTFDEYASKYNYKGPSAVFSENHLKALSENKKRFYSETIRGQELLSEQSSKWKENNPGAKAENRKKTSDRAIKNAKLNGVNGFFGNSYGIRVKFGNYNTRSWEEFCCIWTLLQNNIKFKYEDTTITYIMNNTRKQYLLDLSIDNIYFEIKGDWTSKIDKYKAQEKYVQIEKKLNKVNKQLFIVNYELLCEKLNLTMLNRNELYKAAKELLDKNECSIMQSFTNRLAKPRTISKIDPDWQNNKNIKIIYKGNKECQI